jgi:hypothetical protein
MYEQHDRLQIHLRKVADVLEIVYAYDLVADFLLGPALGLLEIFNSGWWSNQSLNHKK